MRELSRVGARLVLAAAALAVAFIGVGAAHAGTPATQTSVAGAAVSGDWPWG
ncbi:hypothetical protein ACTOB_006452 [Actinoplanes oblitus]|uniref:Uncharacterized protein n=1 Tax=Actinoplanes oblitus TaxID=3040509 RepID=A0ABY8WBG2_9ACTN|nr:hypothetical protein [Actinoplanes oblitus]WIM94428.1 hypothetical protein ACTOB_006452 [Actinoplanes oblitus]